jgi:hypothetical protein
MKRPRPSTTVFRAKAPRVGLYVYAVGVCASALALQSLPSAAAPSFLSDPLDALYRRLGGRDAHAPAASALPDLNVHNLSVHRVRYLHGEQQGEQQQEEDEDDERGECPLPPEPRSIWTTALPEETAGVVVTWDDLPVAAATRDASYSDDVGDVVMEKKKKEKKSSWFPSYRAGPNTKDARPPSNVDVTYELQVWVHGWGLDALWHAANRRVRTREPFAVLTDLPPELELRFRVRAHVVTRWARGWLVDSETAGPWTAPPVALAPSSQHALAAVAAFLVNNKAFFALLAGCIGGGALVLAQLYWRRRMYRKARQQRAHQRFPSVGSCSRRGGDGSSLEQEVRDLRQELADSEAEVRRLMLFRGFGVEALAADELDALAQELQQTLRTVRKLQAAAGGDAKAPMSDSETEEADVDSEQQGASAEAGHAQSDATTKGGRLVDALAAAFPLLRSPAPVSAAAS